MLQIKSTLLRRNFRILSTFSSVLPLLNKEIMLNNSEGLVPPRGTFGVNQVYSDYIECVSMKRLQLLQCDFDKYDWLMHLYDTNRKLFFCLFSKYTSELMPLVYTPTVGLACQNLGLVYNEGRGLFITIENKGNIASILKNWPYKDVKAICVTDGERILGLGDQGAFGMGIPVGKLSLYTGLAGIPPDYLLPVCLDVGTNNEKHLNDTTYFGLKRKRVTGQEYDDFVQEFMETCVETYGKQVLIQFEDFANHNAFRLLQKYTPDYCTFNDDIQGTASVILSVILASQRLTGRKLDEEVILCFGAGEAAIGFAQLFTLAAAKRCGLSFAEARRNLYFIDSKGLVVANRKAGGLNEHKLEFAQPSGTSELTSLDEIINYTKCTTLLGLAAIPKAFNEKVLKLMAQLNEIPVIMALSNPTSMAECTADQAYRFTNGKCIFASGSPFMPLTLTPDQCSGLNTTLVRYPGQANNFYVFPGVALAIISGEIFPVLNEDFLVAAESLSNQVSDVDLSKGCLLPPLSDIRKVSSVLAREVILNASNQGRCHIFHGSKPDLKTIENCISKYSYYPWE